MRINIVTLFPKMFDSFITESIIGRAIKCEYVEVNIVDIRNYCFDKHKQADDMPFGGGHGMVMKAEPILRAFESCGGRRIYTSPQGVRFNQELALELSQLDEITILAGHYEGVDQRVIDKAIDMEISVGDFVLTGGELPAMIISDAIIRLLPHVIKKESYINDSFFNGLLDYPQYTRPRTLGDMDVPDVLVSGDHKKIAMWRLKQSLRATYQKRRDLLKKRKFSDIELKLLQEIIKEENDNEK